MTDTDTTTEQAKGEDNGLRMVNYTRQELILPSEQAREAHVNILGVGTVGSNVAVEAASLGIGNLSICDMDVVEPHNLPSQRFGLDDLDRPKVEACRDQIAAVSHHANVSVRNEPFEAGDPLEPGVVVLAIDNMDVRKEIFEGSIQYFTDLSLLIDPRMGGNKVEIYCIDPSDPDQVSTYLDFAHSFTQEEAAPIPCGGRTVSYTGALIGGIVANYIRLHLTGKQVPLMTQIDLDQVCAPGGGFFTMGKVGPEPVEEEVDADEPAA